MSEVAEIKEGYKDSPFGMIPESWEVKKLGKICDVRDGTHDSPSYYNEGIPFVTSKNLTEKGVDFTNTKFISVEDHQQFSKRSKVDDGDILFGMIGTVGRPVIVNKTFEFSIKNVALLKFSRSNLNNVFALNILKSSIVFNQLRQVADGGVLKFVALGTIRNLNFPIPSEEEQKKIAEILSTVDDKIEVIDERIKQTQELKKGLMQKLLTKGIGHTKFKDSPLGEIPESWEVKKIKSFADVSAGGTPSTKVPEYWNGTIPWMNSGEINLRRVKSVENRITELGLNNSSTRFFNSGTIFIALAGQGKTRGKVAIAEIDTCTNQSLASIYNLKSVSNEFLFQNLESRYSEIRKMSTGDGGRGGLNLSIINSIKVAIPPIIEQMKIAEMLSSVDEKIESLKDKKSDYQELKKGLMQQLLTGKKRVKI